MSNIREEIVHVIKEVVGDLVMNENDYETKLKELGVDSLDTFNILLELEEKFGIAFPEADIEKLNSINSIFTYINKQINQ